MVRISHSWNELSVLILAAYQAPVALTYLIHNKMSATFVAKRDYLEHRVPVYGKFVVLETMYVSNLLQWTNGKKEKAKSSGTNRTASQIQVGNIN
jgi:hypothetical protein